MVDQKVNDDHEKRIKALEDAVKALQTAMDNMGNGGAEVDTGAIMMKINMLSVEINKKIDITVINAQVDSQYDKLKNMIDGLALKVEQNHDKGMANDDQLRAEFEHHKNKDFVALTDRVTALEKLVSWCQNKINNFKIPESGPGGVSEERFVALVERVDALEAELANLRNLFTHWQKNFQDDLNLKADKTALSELDTTIMLRLNDIVAALTKQFADKAETKKALKLLERQVKNLYDLFMSKGNNAQDEDAMFSKKPLGGFSCASCEKDLVNLYGRKVEFMPWSKLPFRDPSERIARVGQGFSKMLSMINPDQLSSFNRGMSQEPTSNTAQNFYPTQEEALQGNFTDVRMPTTLTNGRQSVQVVNKLAADVDGRPGSAHRKKKSNWNYKMRTK